MFMEMGRQGHLEQLTRFSTEGCQGALGPEPSLFCPPHGGQSSFCSPSTYFVHTKSSDLAMPVMTL